MAFHFGASGPSAFGSSVGGSLAFGSNAGGSNSQTQTGPDLEEIQTEGLGFQSLAGDSKVRLLPTPWPSDALPPPTASLLSIASNKGLIAAAGPDSVIVASTESVRQAFTPRSSADNDVKPFSPQLTLSIGMRVSQVAFSADESFLVISAETGGGLAVYDVPALMQGSTQAAFELSTNGVSLRALTPNPTPEKAELFAAVTIKGDLMMANLKSRQFLSSPTGQTMKDGVSCVSWSTRGKQLVAGLGNGTGFQMTPEGEGKAEIPRPLGLDGDQHVSSISWLENNVFLMVHTSSSFDADIVPPSTYNLVTRQPPAAFMFQKLPEPCSPFGLNRSPHYHFIQRLRDFPPNIQDILVVTSTGSTDVGLFTRAKAPLTSGLPAEKVTNVFTTTGMANDSRRAQLSMSEDGSDTSPIGVAIDLSSKDKVKRPLPGEEMDESPSPLPAVMILNNEGILASWWLVYADSIRQGTAYPGLVAVAGSQSQPQQSAARQASPFASASVGQQSQPAFGQSLFRAPSNPAGAFGGGFSKPAAPALGSTSTLKAPTSGAFGAPSGLGAQQSPWGFKNTAPQTGGAAFGKPAFGSSTPFGGSSQAPTFAATGRIGSRQSPWDTPTLGSAAAMGSVFGQSGGLGARAGSMFGGGASGAAFGSTPSSTAPAAGSASGFASFANAGGFAAAVAKSSGQSSLGGATPSASFGSGMDTDTSFRGTPKKSEQTSGGLFGAGSGFTLGSTFKGDGSAKDDAPKPANNAHSSFFGPSFGNVLGETQKDIGSPQVKEADMTEDSESEKEQSTRASAVEPDSTTPVTTPAPPKFSFPGTTPPTASGVYSTQAQNKETPAAVGNSAPANWSFGTQTPSTTTPQVTPQKPEDTIQPSVETPASAIIKPEPEDEGDAGSRGVDRNVPEAPLPPNPLSKASYSPGDSSTSSAEASSPNHPVDDAPFPPDFLASKSKQVEELQPDFPAEGDDDSLEGGGTSEVEEDGEGSGIDVAQEISPTTDPNQTPKVTPESSFGAGPLFERSPIGGLFNKVTQPSSKHLFGEIGKTSAPIFPPPSKVQESPRSPSPIRSFIPGDVLRPDNARSFSAPGLQTKALPDRKSMLSKPLQSSVLTKSQPSIGEQRTLGRERVAPQQAKKKADEDQDLSDGEDEKIRKLLSTEVQATLQLDTFLAHTDYIGNINKPGVPGQIEKLYRDINSMIDTLGLNARSLKAFLTGHSEPFKDGERSREDLEQEGLWTLVEISDLGTLVNEKLEDRLEKARVKSVQEKLNICQERLKDLTKARSRHNEIKKFIHARSDPDQIEATRSAPLNAEQAAIQHDLRKEFMRFQKLLAETEESITILKAKLASHDSSSGKGGPHKVPTVEAVTNTIKKLTSMVEKKSGDIDVLENQMQKLRFSSTTDSGACSSREASPFVTPAKSTRQSQRGTPGSSSTYAPFYTPESTKSQLRASTGSSGGGRSKGRIGGVTPEDVERFQTSSIPTSSPTTKLRPKTKNRPPKKMRSTLLTLLVATASCVSFAAAEGINCEGNTRCSAKHNSGLSGQNDLMDEFYQALANGASDVIAGGPLVSTTMYPLPGQKYIACDPAAKICISLAGNYPSGGVDGWTLATRVGDLNSHGCWYCGSVPLSGDNNPKEMGILKIDIASPDYCAGVCG
ncbi:WD40/YVTN repeat-like-containing domain [Lasallia pustulata]|uniref:WD40/YVTN repeat-like-containing domain n=1 Tax=Lasallia pustulata TaxID=136370 RepID=A0A1W5CX23_9LECA|nr:WD40/YVTN repeat-like-containing domain [Lasallia pustulata]